MFLTPEQTGGPGIWALRHHTRYLALEWMPEKGDGIFREFDVEQLALVLGQDAGETWQEHASLIKLACVDGRLFEWLDEIGGL